MFTNNYINFVNGIFFGTTQNFVIFDGREMTNLRPYDYPIFTGIGQYILKARCRTLAENTGTSSAPIERTYPGVYFGSGSTPASKNDYTLESPITSGLSISNPSSLMYKEKNGKHSYSAEFILKNTTDADINIYEIGLYGQVGYYGSSYMLYPCLYERTVLDEPITIPAGESKLVTYKITFNQILNVE